MGNMGKGPPGRPQLAKGFHSQPAPHFGGRAGTQSAPTSARQEKYSFDDEFNQALQDGRFGGNIGGGGGGVLGGGGILGGGIGGDVGREGRQETRSRNVRDESSRSRSRSRKKHLRSGSSNQASQKYEFIDQSIKPGAYDMISKYNARYPNLQQTPGFLIFVFGFLFVFLIFLIFFCFFLFFYFFCFFLFFFFCFFLFFCVLFFGV